MRHKVIILITVTIWTRQIIASQEISREISVDRFFDLIEQQKLSDEQIRLFTQNEKVEQPLRYAQEQNRKAVIQRLLEARDQHGDTPLLCAIQTNNKQLAQVLLDAGADPNLINPRKLVSAMISSQDYTFHGRFPLAVAALSAINPEMVQLLLDRGAWDPNYDGKGTDSLATTVLKYTSYRRHGAKQKSDLKEIEKMLLLASRQRRLADACMQDRKRQAVGLEGKDGVQEQGERKEKSWWESRCLVS